MCATRSRSQQDEGRTPDATPANDSDSEPTNVLPTADLAITKTTATTIANRGASISYTITVTNNGPSAVTGATMTDSFPSSLTSPTWGCSVTPVAAGNSCGTPVSGNSGNISRSINLNSGASAASPP